MPERLRGQRVPMARPMARKAGEAGGDDIGGKRQGLSASGHRRALAPTAA